MRCLLPASFRHGKGKFGMIINHSLFSLGFKFQSVTLLENVVRRHQKVITYSQLSGFRIRIRHLNSSGRILGSSFVFKTGIYVRKHISLSLDVGVLTRTHMHVLLTQIAPSGHSFIASSQGSLIFFTANKLLCIKTCSRMLVISYPLINIHTKASPRTFPKCNLCDSK